MPASKDLSRVQRDLIEGALAENREVAWAVIGRCIKVHPTTVMREVGRHHGRRRYCAEVAQARADRDRGRARDSKLTEDTAVRRTVVTGLTAKQSPAAIAADLRAAGGATVCAETIYQALYRGCLPMTARECLRTRRPRRRGRQARHPNRRAGLPNIHQRPAPVNDRATPGHFELDLVIGKKNQSGLLTALERRTRYGAIVTLPDGYRAEAVLAAMVELFDQIPPHLLGSVTFDQGSEWADWECLVEHYGMAAWFCDPHSPWQRGAIENFNGHVRYWFPRGTDLARVAPAAADHAATFLNTQRRRLLHWDTAEQHWLAAGGLVLGAPTHHPRRDLITIGSRP